MDSTYVSGMRSRLPDARVKKLMESISNSKEITPLIVAYDSQGPYILEGGHRYDALIKMGAKSFPAMVVIENNTGGTK